jgi:ADP-ribose pyrophosphatase
MGHFDAADCFDRYRVLMRTRPNLFVNPLGGLIGILTNPDEVTAARQQEIERRSRSSLPVDDLRVGVLATDHYLGWLVRDAVRFSDGSMGLYNRVLTGPGGLVLPLLPTGVALIQIFRHAARRWFLEAPGGSFDQGEDFRNEVRREMHEEIGANAMELVELGSVATSPGLTNETLSLFAARIDRVGHPETAEGISGIRIVPFAGLDDLILNGDINDGPTIVAIMRARLKGLF